ncbi:MAG TPA: hypothetical protein VFE60_00255 [Roseiarcus sp.]|jgi:hypothetical protein|nr:hypothetical protein [Roseiarcus sp.]
MAWLKNIFGGIRRGLDERAQVDIDALTNVILKCLVVEESRQICRQWITEQIVNAREKNASDLTVSVFSKFVLDVTGESLNAPVRAQQKRMDMRAGIDEILWQIKQSGRV